MLTALARDISDDLGGACSRRAPRRWHAASRANKSGGVNVSLRGGARIPCDGKITMSSVVSYMFYVTVITAETRRRIARSVSPGRDRAIVTFKCERGARELSATRARARGALGRADVRKLRSWLTSLAPPAPFVRRIVPNYFEDNTNYGGDRPVASRNAVSISNSDPRLMSAARN